MKKAALIILDGWGLGAIPESDAIAQAQTPFMDKCMSDHPNATLTTFGEVVGLPKGQMGNSEVGHLNIGAGRVVYQELLKINDKIKSGEFAQHSLFRDIVEYVESNDATLHVMGLLSDGGVHSHIQHLFALIDAFEDCGLTRSYIHAFTDGRDVDPKSGAGHIKKLLDFLETKPAELASVIGRYYAMDRDKRWERIKHAYDLLVHAKGIPSYDVCATIDEMYANGLTDEFLKPISLKHSDDESQGLIKNGDVCLFFNFRTDRPRQLTEVLCQRNFPTHHMESLDLRFITMTRYDDTFKNVEVMFDDKNIELTFGEIISNAGLSQVRIAETEKYPHVTYFFSGGREKPFDGETRLMIPSPKVATYDLQPEMSAPEVTRAIILEINNNYPPILFV